MLIVIVVTAMLVAGKEASAWDPVKDLTGKPLHEHGEKAAREVGNALKDTAREADKLGRKTIKEIGNAGEDLRILVEEGKCGGDVCDALDAAVKFTESNVIDAGKTLERAAERIQEGKLIDALWHLGVDPLNDTQENAAEAAARSSVLRAVGQVAAGAYLGPGGAAAYAAWLTYNMTDGDLELALKAGVISGATAVAMTSISNVEGIDAIKGVSIDEIAQRAVLSGAVAGMAVAASGGDQAAIQNAITAGITMSVIRDGYKELTTTNLEDNLKASTGEPYCLGATPVADGGKILPCLPPDGAYQRNADGSIKYRFGKPEIDVTKLDALRPHVGMFATTGDDSGVITESTSTMQAISKIPGMNAMAVGHDVIDSRFNTIADIPFAQNTMMRLELVTRVATIAPTIALTYEGAGYRVHEMIRNEAVRSREARLDNEGDIKEPQNTVPVSEGGTSAGNLNGETAYEIRNMVCKGDGIGNADLMEIHLDPASVEEGGRTCTIYRAYASGWRHIWHAHNETASCVRQFNRMATRSLRRGMRCFFSVGLRYGEPASIDVVTGH
ncbi:MAG: hypothetical protein ACE363_14765 [Alphaproteobacteria bacterium]